MEKNLSEIPLLTVDFVKLLELNYPNEYEFNADVVGTPEYWKKAGILELIGKLNFVIKRDKAEAKED